MVRAAPNCLCYTRPRKLSRACPSRSKLNRHGRQFDAYSKRSCVVPTTHTSGVARESIPAPGRMADPIRRRDAAALAEVSAKHAQTYRGNRCCSSHFQSSGNNCARPRPPSIRILGDIAIFVNMDRRRLGAPGHLRPRRGSAAHFCRRVPPDYFSEPVSAGQSALSLDVLRPTVSMVVERIRRSCSLL